MKYEWVLKPFAALSNNELYELLRLRSEVFVVEQNCVFLDMDRSDAPCHHLMGWVGIADVDAGSTELVACARIVPPGIKYAEPSIGRVATSPAQRGRGLGRALMLNALESTYRLYGNRPIRIGAQQYLLNFYRSLGFIQDGEMYLEDDIPHIEMVKTVY